MQCEKCKKNHNGLYGSGRFCSLSCAQSRNQKLVPYTGWNKFFEKKEFVKNCPKCNKEFIITRNIKFNFKKTSDEKEYCSRTCANSRGPRTEDFKEKVRLKLKKEKIILNKICKLCNQKFITKSKIKKFCSNKCQGKYSHSFYLKKYSPEERSAINRKAYLEGNNYVAGGRTKWLNYKNIKVQGTYELRTCLILDKWKELCKIKDWEYTNDRFIYNDINNIERTYILDFKIINNDDSFYYLETKGRTVENDILKWKAVINKGFDLKIWFNKQIKEEEAKIKYLN